MSQKYDLGITAQYLIAKKFNLEVSSALLNKINVALDKENYQSLTDVIDEIFNATTIELSKCTSLSSNYSVVPYQFLTTDGKSVSIRCNKSNDRVAVRYLGQPGKKIINQTFASILGKQLDNSNDYKKLFIEHTTEILPLFVDAFFDADYIIWIYKDKQDNKFKYHFIDGNSDVKMEFSNYHITNTQTLDSWNNSNIIKYDNEPLANIQIFKDSQARTWIFRFCVGTLLKYIEKSNSNNETLGATAERSICSMFNLSWKKEDNLDLRYDPMLAGMLEDTIMFAFSNPEGLPRPIQYVGSEKGVRLGNSKCSYDFILEGNKTLSLKTNLTGAKVCPPEIGQPSAKTAYLYFSDFVDENYIDLTNFKLMVLNHIDKLIPMYLDYLFDSDYLLRIFPSKRFSFHFESEVYEKGFGKNFKWNKQYFSFSKSKLEDWNESNTVKYDGITIGEFQVHKSRNCYKFRFDLEGLKAIICKKKLYVE